MKKILTLFIGVLLALPFTSNAQEAISAIALEGAADSAINVVKAIDRAPAAFAPTTNIRYVDMDVLIEKCCYAMDVNRMVQQALGDLQKKQQEKAAEIQKLANSIESKMKKGTYKSQTAYESDVKKLQKMQEDAQKLLADLEQQSQTDLAKKNEELNRIISAYLVDYNATRHYDAILIKASGLYFNPALDITMDIVNGLNDQYEAEFKASQSTPTQE